MTTTTRVVGGMPHPTHKEGIVSTNPREVGLSLPFPNPLTRAPRYAGGIRMQPDIAGGDIGLLGGTIRLLTLGSQPRGVAPKALHPHGYGWLPTPPGCLAHTVLSTPKVLHRNGRMSFRTKQFYPSKRVPYRLGATPDTRKLSTMLNRSK